MQTTENQAGFVICVSSEGHEDLEVWKIYRVLPDARAAEVGCLRVVDESGEDYLYPAIRFVGVEFSEEVRARLLAAAATA
jgi:hypothetical protein